MLGKLSEPSKIIRGKFELIVSITGGSGFVGGYLKLFHLQRGDEVRVLSRNTYNDQDNLKFFRGDISGANSNLEGFVKYSDVLYHCAAELTNTASMHAVNVKGTKRLAELARGNIGRWVQLSSAGSYGVHKSGVIDESRLDNPIGLYEETKVKADKIILDKAISDAMDVVILRPSIVFGETMKNQSLSKMVNMIKKKLFFYIGNNEALVNYVHVSDVVNALYLCATHQNAVNGTYIVSQCSALKDMVEAFSKGVDTEPPNLRVPEFIVKPIAKVFGGLPGFPLTEDRLSAMTRSCRYDSSLICNELGFSFHQSLAAAFENYARSIQNE